MLFFNDRPFSVATFIKETDKTAKLSVFDDEGVAILEDEQMISSGGMLRYYRETPLEAGPLTVFCRIDIFEADGTTPFSDPVTIIANLGQTNPDCYLFGSVAGDSFEIARGYTIISGEAKKLNLIVSKDNKAPYDITSTTEIEVSLAGKIFKKSEGQIVLGPVTGGLSVLLTAEETSEMNQETEQDIFVKIRHADATVRIVRLASVLSVLAAE